jgi:hypothetical protein
MAINGLVRNPINQASRQHWSASTQKPLSNVLDSRQLGTRRLYQPNT